MSGIAMFNGLKSHQNAEPQTEAAGRFLLWVDGVGAWLLCLGDRVTIGGPGGSGEGADITLLANLSRRHAAIDRSGEAYVLQAIGSARVNNRGVENQTDLNHNYQIFLGENVRLQYRHPSPLSRTATLEFLSDHRPAQSVDGVILMDDTCLLGPGIDNHVRCPDWDNNVLLFRRDGEFRCKVSGQMLINGRPAEPGSSFAIGDVVTGPDGRFRLEPLDAYGSSPHV